MFGNALAMLFLRHSLKSPVYQLVTHELSSFYLRAWTGLSTNHTGFISNFNPVPLSALLAHSGSPVKSV